MRHHLARLALALAVGLGLTAPAWGQVATKRTAPLQVPAARTKAAKVDLNTATAEELQELPGVGPARAEAIIKARPFHSVADLKKLDEIPARVYDEIAPRLHVTEAAAAKKATPRVTMKKAGETKAAAKEATHSGTKVDLNTATADELQELPGIGPARAEAIIEARPFKAVADLKKVEDVPARVYDEIAPRLTATPHVASAARPAVKPSAKAPATRKTAVKEATKEDDAATQTRKKTALAPGRKINLNKADVEELQELPGVGPVRSAAIIKGRPFETPEDVMKVDGIKEGIYALLKDHISVK